MYIQRFLESRGPQTGRVVRVVAMESRFDESAIAAAIDTGRTLHEPRPGSHGQHCWHICKLGHRIRFLLPPETPCESWGSLTHILHDDMAVSGVERIVPRLFLKEAQLECAGGARDEAVVAEIARCIVDRFGRDPHVKAPRGEVSYSLTKLRRQLGHWLWQVDAGDLVDQPRLEWQRGGSCSELVPTALDPGIARAVMRGVTKDRGRAVRDSHGRKVLKPLDFTASSKRVVGKDVTVSVVRASLKSWLASEAGAAWRATRASLFDPDRAAGASDSD